MNLPEKGVSMALRDKYHFEDLVNVAEHLVIDEVERQLSDPPSGFRETEDSIMDTVALALNNLPPMYRVNLLGRMYEPVLDQAHRDEIQRAVSDALEKVAQNPPRA